MIDSLVGLCRTDTSGVQAYIHVDLIDKFVVWLNENNPGMGENNNDMGWKTIALDTEALLDFKKSDNLSPLVIGRIKIGYAKGVEYQDYYKNLLNQAFPSRFRKMK